MKPIVCWQKGVFMIKQLEFGSRNVDNLFYESKLEQIDLFNEILKNVQLSREEERTLIWLASWEESTVKNVVSILHKVKKAEAATKRLEQLQ